MSAHVGHLPLEEQIGHWRLHLQRRGAIRRPDVEELETHLRDMVASLRTAGLSDDEAFLVAVKRIGSLDEVSREFAREHSERLWKQLVLSDSVVPGAGSSVRDGVVAFGLATAAAMVVKLAMTLVELAGVSEDEFFAKNVSLLILPFLAAYFAWKRGVDRGTWVRLALPFLAAAIVINLVPFGGNSQTLTLAGMHLPIALWMVIGMAYAGSRWASSGGRMDFVRFTGELLIYYALIALGGGVLTGFTLLIFSAIGVDTEWLVGRWIVPCGATGAVLVAAWLVEAKQSVVENMAPVLTRLFSPLFTIVLLTFAITMAFRWSPILIERDVLIAFDLLLVLVLGLVVYSASARDPEAPPNLFDRLQLLLVVSALAVDVIALAAVGARISEYGFTPNRVAALGENLILLVNLAWTARVYASFLRGRTPFTALEQWQTRYLPVFSVWAAIVVLVFPPVFGYR
jgi:hypothetical protein